LWVPRSPGGLARVLHLLSFALSSFPVMLRQAFWRPDLVLSVAPAFVCAPTALLVARLCGAKAWLHLQDFEVDVAFRMGLLKGKLLQRLVLHVERSLLGRFDRVSSISRRMVERLVAKGVRPERTHLFPNWVDLTDFDIRPDPAAYRAELGIDATAKVVLFSGSLGGKQGLMVIPAIAKLLAKREDIVFVVCGSGIMKRQLELATAGLANVILLPLQPIERLGSLLAMADMHLLPQNPDAADLVLPSKLSGMLASGRPVIASCHAGTEIATVISSCGIVVRPGDVIEWRDAVCQLADDAALRRRLGAAARMVAAEQFERNAVLKKMFAAAEAPVDGALPETTARLPVVQRPIV
jgi:colanic acid biosynthesis glycosyl transferase WcaI